MLPEPQRVSGQRRYEEDTVDRLRLIGAGKEAGFSLEEIADLLRSSDRGRGSERLRMLAAAKLAEVEALIERATHQAVAGAGFDLRLHDARSLRPVR